MALKELLAGTILITILIGLSTALIWNPNIRRYESYDLHKGPVFYEAYYPDTKEGAPKDYQEKRYFDRDAVLERSYQVPSNRFIYPPNNLRIENSQNQERFTYPDSLVEPRSSPTEDNIKDRRTFPSEVVYSSRKNFLDLPLKNGDLENVRNEFSDTPASKSLDIREISSLARRAISRDLENWNALESYLDRANYPEEYPTYSRQIIDLGPPTYDPLKKSVRDLKEEKLYEDSLKLRSELQSLDQERKSDVLRRLPSSDFAKQHSSEMFGSMPRQNEQVQKLRDVIRRSEPVEGNTSYLNKQDLRVSPIEPNVDSIPPENIFEPRPQVINYIFSKKTIKPSGGKIQSVSSTKEESDDSNPRNYGDNLIQEEIKKTENAEDVKVTSIEISEEPRHKTRHHHGEWPKRNYNHHHQS